MKKLCIVFCLSLFLTGCQSQVQEDNQNIQTEQSKLPQSDVDDTLNDQHQENNMQNEGNRNMKQLLITIDNQNFSITLEENKTVEALIRQLPMTITMDELHGNEKYYYMNQKLPTQPQSINYIKAGDFLLFGNDCLVLFYESFSTSYSYTRLGHVDNVEAFVNKLGNGSIEITIHQ